jgi:hypothetical protein
MDGERRPQVWLVGFGDSSLDFELVVWLTAEATKRPSAVKAGFLWALETALGKYGLEIPFPQRDLNLRSAFGLRGDSALALLGNAESRARLEPTTVDLGVREREKLARNDALEEVERAARDEAARKVSEDENSREAAPRRPD